MKCPQTYQFVGRALAFAGSLFLHADEALNICLPVHICASCPLAKTSAAPYTWIFSLVVTTAIV
jgi:hypothetical protein